jgi:hypothetical protein
MQIKALCSFRMSDNYPGNTESNPRWSEPFTDSLAKCVHGETGRYQYNTRILYCPIHTSWLIWVKFTIDVHRMLFMRDLHIILLSTRILSKFAQEGLCFSYEHKWTHIYTWFMKQYDIFKVKKSLIKSVYCIRNYNISKFLILLNAGGCKNSSRFIIPNIIYYWV